MSEDKSIPISSDALAAWAMGAPDILPSDSLKAEKEAAAGNSENTEAEDELLPVDPRFPITVLPGFCTRLAGSTCERCTLVCPYDAISFDSKGRPQIDEEYCSRCGLCCGVCDAFATKRITMNDLIEKVRRLSGEGEPVFFVCYDQVPPDFEVHPNVIVLPCIGSVAPEFWASALEVNPNLQVYCDFSFCDNCPTAGPNARELFTHAINVGEMWSQVHMGKTEILPEKTDLLSRFFEATSDEYQRRGVAKSLAYEMEDIASGKYRKRNSETLMNFHAQKDSLRAMGHATNAHNHKHVPSTPELRIEKQWPRLHLIATAVQEHPDMAPRVPRYLAAVDNARCEHCYQPCFSHCPSGARALDHEGNVIVDPLLCIACGNCARYCPCDAAYLFETDGSIFLNCDER